MNTLKTTLKLEMAYTVNSFQYHLRRTPLIKKLFKNSSYEVQDVKLAITILAELFKALKLIFFAALFYAMPALAAGLRLEDGTWSERFSLFVLLTFVLFLCGAIANNQMMGTDANDYYSVCLLRMNAREYFLSSYFLGLAEHFILTGLFTLIICLIFKGPLWFALVFPIFQFCIKIDFSAIRFLLYKKLKISAPDPLGKRSWVSFLVVFLGSIALLALAVTPPLWVLLLIAAVPVLAFVPALMAVLHFEDYLLYFKRIYTEKASATAAVKNNAIITNTKLIDVGTVDIQSDKTGFAFMNDCFEKRHHKLIADPIKRITIVAAVLAVGVNVLMFFNHDLAKRISVELIKVVTILPFAFYAINRGQGYTLALFSNCDRTMLNYSFYRKPRNILSLFRIRLVSTAKLNLVPAAVISVSLVALKITSTICGFGIENLWANIDFLQLLLLLIAPLSVSIFFSAHYLILYYLIQPFDSEAKAKAPLYVICTTGTYIISYWMAVIKPLRQLLSQKPILFTIILVVFCLLYSAFGCLLVYRVGPKHFKPKR